MATRPETEIDRRLAPTAAEYVDEEHAAAEEESREAAGSDLATAVVPLRRAGSRAGSRADSVMITGNGT